MQRNWARDANSARCCVLPLLKVVTFVLARALLNRQQDSCFHLISFLWLQSAPS